MLESLRRYSSSTMVKVLYGVLALLFVVWGVGAVGLQRMDVVARVYGQPVTKRDLDRATELLQRRYDEIFKGRVSMPGLDLRGRAFDDLLNEALLQHEAQQLGLEVTDAELVAAITTMPEFQENGRFSRDLLERLLQAQRDRGEFEDSIRRTLVFQRLQTLITDGAQVSDAEVETRFQLDHEQVDLDTVHILAADLARTITPTDAELAATLERHADRYRVPEQVRARFVVYRRTEFKAAATVTDQQIADYYNENKDQRFTASEQVRARHILVKVDPGATDAAKAAARKKADDLLKKVRAGEPFAELAKKHSDDPGSAVKGGDLGLFPRGKMVPEFDAAAFALPAGGVSEVTESDFGLHIIKVDEHQPGGVRTLDEVREEISGTLQNQQAIELARGQAEADRRQIARGKTLADIGRPVEETALFGRSDLVPGIGHVPNFADAAFALNEGQVSDLIETEDAIYLLSPFEHREAHAPALVDVRDRVAADAAHDRGETLAHEKADAVLAQARTEGLAKAAAAAGFVVVPTGLFDRRAPSIPNVGAAADLRDDAFTLTAEAPLGPRVYTVASDAFVVALRERKPADMSGVAAAKDSLHESLLQQKRSALLTSYLNYLKERAVKEKSLEITPETAAVPGGSPASGGRRGPRS